jgi:CDGSH-type Zn-finger protein
MSETPALPKIAGLSPVKVALTAGQNYAFCTCGLSDSQPFCNGAHKGTGLRPNVFTATQTEEVWMCLCKHTQQPYQCDGSHKPLRQKAAES